MNARNVLAVLIVAGLVMTLIGGIVANKSETGLAAAEELNIYQILFLGSALLSICFTVAMYFWKHKERYPADKFNPKYLFRSIPLMLTWWFAFYDVALNEVVPSSVISAIMLGWVFGGGLEVLVKQAIDIVSKAWPDSE